VVLAGEVIKAAEVGTAMVVGIAVVVGGIGWADLGSTRSCYGIRVAKREEVPPLGGRPRPGGWVGVLVLAGARGQATSQGRRNTAIFNHRGRLAHQQAY